MAVGYCKHSQVVTLIVSVFADLLFPLEKINMDFGNWNSMIDQDDAIFSIPIL